MKNYILLLGFILILLSLNFISASHVYNWRYQGDKNEPSTSYYSGYWNDYSGSSSYSRSDYVPVSQKLKTFNGPYTEVHKQNTAQYPRPISNPSPKSNNFQAGGGYVPSTYYGGYAGYGYYPSYFGYYSYSYYDYYYPAYYW